jgi:hypothetical protein
MAKRHLPLCLKHAIKAGKTGIRPMRSILLFLAAMLAPFAAHPQTVVTSTITSPGPDAGAGNVSVSVYRNPERSDGGQIRLNYLRGFALISETRTIRIPAGETTIRFEGVADGILAVSAVVTGLPGGVVQKNRDAALLSPASLVDGSLGNRVRIRRTNPITGKMVEEDAVIRSGPGGRVVFQTAAGYEALRCSGLPEGLIFDGVPAGLSAKPTLSVTTRSDRATEAKVTLTYLATGFDWAANYVATINPDGKTLSLFAWLTLANSNGASFKDAQLLAIAGTLKKEGDYDALVEDAPPPQLNLTCFPLGSGKNGLPQPQPEPEGRMRMDLAPPPVMMTAPVTTMNAEKIVVTGSRIARQEDLGDLKLYRVPMRVTVAANGQKQVALLQKPSVAFKRIYEGGNQAGHVGKGPIPMILRFQNEEKDGLGVPLPSGGLAVFEESGARILLAGQDNLRDHAVKEKVEVRVQRSTAVQYQQTFLDVATLDYNKALAKGGPGGRFELRITNAKPYAIDVEWSFSSNESLQISALSAKLKRKDGDDTWFVRVPANGEAVLTYKLRRIKG